jgi:hypothetical protein
VFSSRRGFRVTTTTTHVLGGMLAMIVGMMGSAEWW